MLAVAVRAEHAPTLDLLGRLVAQPSVEGNDEAIRACLDLIHEAISSIPGEVVRLEHEGLPALIARFGEGPPARRVAFAGHIDVVPAEGDWSSPPFAMTRIGETVVGRGVTDMKAGVAASVGAVRALAASGALAECAVELVITGDEEVGSRRGMQALLAHGEIASHMAICGEPTGLDVYLGNRGVAWYEIAIHGRGGHAGQTHALASPVTPAIELCRALGVMTFPTVDERFDPPTPSLTVSRIDAGAGGHALNVVPDTVTIGIDRRLLPAESIDEAAEAVRRLTEEIVRPPFRFDLRVLRRWPPCETPPEHPLSQAAVAAVRSVGRGGRFGMDLAANDSSFLVEHGIPALLLGPGAPAEAHVTDERLDVRELDDAIAIYAELALRCARWEP